MSNVSTFSEGQDDCRIRFSERDLQILDEAQVDLLGFRKYEHDGCDVEAAVLLTELLHELATSSDTAASGG